jgi:hypothetical protein
MNRFKIVSECPSCQAFADGRVLFGELERLAGEHELEPLRIARALGALVGQWNAVAAEYTAGGPLNDEQAEDLVGNVLRDVEYSLRTYLRGDSPSHAH